jgi:hypothetical protein
MTKSRTIVIILTALAIIAVVVLTRWAGPLKSALGDEPYKIFLQFSLVTVGGGLVSTVLSELRREMESREARRQALRSFHATTVCAYNRAKKLRRLMNPLVLHEVNGMQYVRKHEYVALMRELEEVQLEFEGMRRQVSVARDLFATAPEVEAFFDDLEKFLREVLKEFERTSFQETETESSLSSFPRLQTLIDDRNDGDRKDGFVSKFSGGYDRVEATLLKLTME